MSVDDGGPAFGGTHDEPGLEMIVTDEGMSLRDYYAGQAMQGMIASGSGVFKAHGDNDPIEKTFARYAYFYADFMIARKRETEKAK